MVSGASTELVYWDTCIFYALLNKEDTHGHGVLDAIASDYESFFKGEISLVTSTITIAEVAEGNFENPKDYEIFKSLKFAPKFKFQEAIVSIMETASEIKDYYFNNPVGENGEFSYLNIGDAIHLATAIKLNVDRFMTLDRKHKKRTGEIGLLKLENPIAGKYDLNMQKPRLTGQMRLGLNEEKRR